MDSFRRRLMGSIKGKQSDQLTRLGQPIVAHDPSKFIAPHSVSTLDALVPAHARVSAPGGADVDPADPEAGEGSMDLKQRYLSEIEIFCDLSREEIDHLAKTTTMFTTERGRVLYFPEEAGEVVFLLKKGRVQLYRISSEGRKLVIANLAQGAIFGEMSLIGQGMYNTFAEAMEDCLICIMSRQEMAQLLVDKPQIALRTLEVMGRRLQNAETQLEEVAFKKVPERVALLLLRLAGISSNAEEGEEGTEGVGRIEDKASESGGARIISGLTHQDLAEMVATHRETVSFTLNDFKARGLVEMAPKCITILNVDGLRALCS